MPIRASQVSRGNHFRHCTQINALQAQIDALSGTDGSGGLIIAGGGVGAGFIAYTSSPEGIQFNEPVARFPIPRDGQLVALAVNPYTNTLNGPAIVTVRVNGAETALQVVVPAGSNTVELFATDVVVAAGDRVTLKIDTTGASSGFVGLKASYQYVAQ